MEIKPFGDSAVILMFEDAINEEILTSIHFINSHILSINHEGIVETVPAYNSLIIHYNSNLLSYKDLERLLENQSEVKNQILIERKTVRIPVLYDGVDIDEVIEHTGLSRKEIVKRHTDSSYTVYMLGFMPGFPYLGGMDESLRTPRKAVPRTKVDAGSVGIADRQTGIYPFESPGGWQIIGRTPLKLFDINRQTPALINAFDILEFYEISEEEFINWETKYD